MPGWGRCLRRHCFSGTCHYTLGAAETLAQAANHATDSEPGQCKDCDKTGVAILPVVYAVAPFDTARGLPVPSPGSGAPVTDRDLAQSRYYLRVLPQGYLHVLKPGKTWDAYVVDASGLLRMITVAQLPGSPTEQRPMSELCRRHGDNIAAQVFALDPERHPQVWVAYSRFRWTDAVLQDYATNRDGCCEQRMLQVDVAAFCGSGNPPRHCHWASSQRTLSRHGAPLRGDGTHRRRGPDQAPTL